MVTTRIGRVIFPSPTARSSSKAAMAEMKHTSAVHASGGGTSIIHSMAGIKTTATIIRFAISHTSIPPGTVLISRQGPQQLLLSKVRPEHISKVEFRIGGLPDQKIGCSHLPAGPDDEIRVRHPG